MEEKRVTTVLRLCGGLALLATPALSQSIAVGTNVQVSASHAGINHYEVELRAHPTDANRLIACSMFREEGRFGLRVWVSGDAGRSWQHSLDVTEGSAADPTCAFARNGTAYFVATTTGTDRFRVYRSPDGGRNWLPPMLTPESPGLDRQYIAVDNSGGPNDGTVYLTSWGEAAPTAGSAASESGGPSLINLWTSLDSGLTWSAAAQMPASQGFRFDNSSIPVIARDGSVLMSVIESEFDGSGGARREG